MANLDNKNLVALGKKMLNECPNNDWVIYKNTFKMCLDTTADVKRVESKYAKMVLQHEADKLERELYRLYISNYAAITKELIRQELYRRVRRSLKALDEAETKADAEQIYKQFINF